MVINHGDNHFSQVCCKCLFCFLHSSSVASTWMYLEMQEQSWVNLQLNRAKLHTDQAATSGRRSCHFLTLLVQEPSSLCPPVNLLDMSWRTIRLLLLAWMPMKYCCGSSSKKTGRIKLANTELPLSTAMYLPSNSSVNTSVDLLCKCFFGRTTPCICT